MRPGIYKGRPCRVLEGPRPVWHAADWLQKVQVLSLLIQFESPARQGKWHTAWVRAGKVTEIKA